MRHLYVHIPLCRGLCAYCDFSTELIGPHARAGRVEAYMAALREELAARRHLLATPLDTIYVGGGTPTAVPLGLLAPFLRDLGGLLAPGGEYTVEADPADVDARLLETLAGCGITRLSVGVQSFAHAARRALGRHTPRKRVEAAVSALGARRWDDWNLDLVFGAPGTGAEEAAADVAAAIAARPSHISLYDLTYTASYAARVEKLYGPAARLRAEEAAEQGYEAVRLQLQAGGYRRYEVSNYALPGRESRHNLAYWRAADYVGLGAGAVSTVGLRRTTGPPTVLAYLGGEAPEVEVLTPHTRLYERAMLGLRTAEGVAWKDVASVVDVGVVEALSARGLAEKACATLRLTPRGLDLSTAVLTAVLRPVAYTVQSPDV